MALLRVGVEVAVLLTLAVVVGRSAGWFRRPVVRRCLEAASGAVLIGLGVRLATLER